MQTPAVSILCPMHVGSKFTRIEVQPRCSKALHSATFWNWGQMVPTGVSQRNYFLSASDGTGPGDRKRGQREENGVTPKGPGGVSAAIILSYVIGNNY